MKNNNSLDNLTFIQWEEKQVVISDQTKQISLIENDPDEYANQLANRSLETFRKLMTGK